MIRIFSICFKWFDFKRNFIKAHIRICYIDANKSSHGCRFWPSILQVSSHYLSQWWLNCLADMPTLPGLSDLTHCSLVTDFMFQTQGSTYPIALWSVANKTTRIWVIFFYILYKLIEKIKYIILEVRQVKNFVYVEPWTSEFPLLFAHCLWCCGCFLFGWFPFVYVAAFCLPLLLPSPLIGNSRKRRNSCRKCGKMSVICSSNTTCLVGKCNFPSKWEGLRGPFHKASVSS